MVTDEKSSKERLRNRKIATTDAPDVGGTAPERQPISAQFMRCCAGASGTSGQSRGPKLPCMGRLEERCGGESPSPGNDRTRRPYGEHPAPKVGNQGSRDLRKKARTLRVKLMPAVEK